MRPTSRLLLLGLLTLTVGCGRDPVASAHDPHVGLDANGRIPKCTLPADIVDPQRWRYIPEGRIVPGNLFQRFFVTSFAVPLLFYDSEIGAGGGVAVTDIDFREQRRREFAGIFLTWTTEGQQHYGINWQRLFEQRDLPDGGVIQEERHQVNLRAGYQRTLTSRFFGLGPSTETRDESSYLDEAWYLNASVQTTLSATGPDLLYAVGTRHEYHNLARGRVEDAPTTAFRYPTLFNDADECYGGWVDLAATWDSRDSAHNPYRGGHVGLRLELMPYGSDGAAGGKVSFDASWAWPLPPLFHDGGDADEENPPTDCLAIGGGINHVFGDLPFYELPTLGGANTLRAFIANRFTDRNAWHTSAEYRFWFIPRGFAITDEVRIERIGAALFADVGSVAPTPGDLFAGAIHHSLGVSLRVAFERAAVFRGDVGFGEGNWNLVLRFGQAF